MDSHFFFCNKSISKNKNVSPSPCPLPSRAREKSDGFPLFDQVEDKFPGNDPSEARLHRASRKIKEFY